MFRQNKEALERLSNLYIICNTPLFLYKRFREDSFVKHLADSNSTNQLIEYFLEIGKKGIFTLPELATAYAIYISLTFKDYESVARFYENEGNINFEWFGDIKQIYISSYTHTNERTISTSEIRNPVTIKILPAIANKSQITENVFTLKL